MSSGWLSPGPQLLPDEPLHVLFPAVLVPCVVTGFRDECPERDRDQDRKRGSEREREKEREEEPGRGHLSFGDPAGNSPLLRFQGREHRGHLFGEECQSYKSRWHGRSTIVWPPVTVQSAIALATDQGR